MKIKHLTILLCILSISLNGYSQELNKQKPDEKGINWKTFTSKKYSIKYPTEWTLDDTKQFGPAIFFFSPVDSETDNFKENVNVLVQDLTGHNLNLERYAKLSEGQIKTMATNSEIILSEKIKTEKSEYHKIIYTADQGIFNLKFEQHYWIKNNEAFVVTFTSQEDAFDKYKTTYEKLLNSFKLDQSKNDKKL